MRLSYDVMSQMPVAPDPGHRTRLYEGASSAMSIRPDGASPARGAGRLARDPGPRPSVPLAVRLVTLAALALATVAAFAGVLRNGWVIFDDAAYVLDHPVVSRGLSLRGALLFLHEPHGANWVPLTALSHMLDVSLFGLSPAGHHAHSLLLHVLNALLVALVLSRMTGAWWRSALVAGLFALHPLRVESVAWIAERKDVLSALFFLLTLGAYALWVERPGRLRFGMVAAALALGLMSKPMLVTTPFLLVVLDVWPLGRLAPGRGASKPRAPAGPGPGASARTRAPRRTLAGLVAEKWPLFALAAAGALVAFLVQRQAGALAVSEWVPLGRRTSNALISCWRYVAMTLWPDRLAVFHPFPADPGAGAALVAAAGLAGVTAAALAFARRLPWLATGWLWYPGMLVPVLGLVQTGSQAYADRFTYLPGIGLAIVIVWAGAGVFGRSRARRVTGAVAALAVLAACGLATARQVPVWRDTRTLFTRVLDVEGGNPLGARVAHRMMGWELLREGRTREAVPHLEASLGLAPGYEDSLRRALAARPDDVETRRELAATLARETRVEEAVREYGAILAQRPDDVDAINNIAWIRATHYQAAHRDGREAVRLAERARDLCPEPVAAVYSTLAAAYAEAGRFPDAVRAGTRAVELARTAGRQDDADRYAEQLACYRVRRPYHFRE